MPWKETCVMDERLEFISACLKGDKPMAWICEQYGISRKTGYKWLERYRLEGPAGLEDRSRAPITPSQIAPEARQAILELRLIRPHRGADYAGAIGIHGDACNSYGIQMCRQKTPPLPHKVLIPNPYYFYQI